MKTYTEEILMQMKTHSNEWGNPDAAIYLDNNRIIYVENKNNIYECNLLCTEREYDKFYYKKRTNGSICLIECEKAELGEVIAELMKINKNTNLYL